MSSIPKLLFLFAMFAYGHVTEAFRILLLSPIPSSSHSILGGALVKTLLGAGHEVVYVTPLPNTLPAHPKFLEVDVSSKIKYFPIDVVTLTKFLDSPDEPLRTVDFLDQASLYGIEIMKHEAVQNVLTDGNKFDAVIAEWMFSEIYVGLSAVLDCPFIWFSTMEPHSMILSLIDEETNPAYNADIETKHLAPFTFFQRVEQLFKRLFLTGYREYFVRFKETKYFNDFFLPMMKKLGKDLPSYYDLRYNASLVLSNSHVSLGQANRLPQNLISIGGYHIDTEVKVLSEDVKNIMDKATNGVIYFSMGSILKSKDFPEKLKLDLVNMFGSLKQTIIWKFEEDFSNLPNNVHVLKWASQQSILNHPNCILFITHGGLLSLTESIHFGVPIIGVPGFADQFVNVMRAELKGFAKKVDLSYNLAKDLKIAIDEMLNNPRYSQNVKALSFIYHDRPVHPRKELVHWVEHVIKTQGAPMLKSPALSLSFYQKFYLDLALVIIVAVLILLKVIKRLIFVFTNSKLTEVNTKMLNSKKKK